LSYLAFSLFFETPQERVIARELNQMTSNYQNLNRKMDQLKIVLADIQQRDDNIYRMIFESEPIPQTVRQAGTGGINRYEKLRNYSNSDLIREVDQQIDKLARQMHIQSVSYDELLNQTKKQEQTLRSRPAIQPVDNNDLSHTASGFGERIHPIFGTKFFHKGMDFTAPIGTKVYATGDGTVAQKGVMTGFGDCLIIDHGNGYRTLYAHLDAYAVKEGHKVKRGQVIGTVGNTGISIGPHLHYEVHKNGKPMNPINYFFIDLTPEQYVLMHDLANVGKTFD
jgi:murein DD-endopeptidase MepM/ murein hydrolase activator NlpD